MAESFNAALKNECPPDRLPDPGTRAPGRCEVHRILGTIRSVGTPGFSTGVRGKPARNTWNGSPQRELTNNPLSGKLGADHAAIVTLNHDSFPHGKHDTMPVRATGFPTPAITEAGKLPPGVKFTAGKNGTATIAGTPAASAKGKTYIIQLTATSKAGSATQKFTLKVT